MREEGSAERVGPTRGNLLPADSQLSSTQRVQRAGTDEQVLPARTPARLLGPDEGRADQVQPLQGLDAVGRPVTEERWGAVSGYSLPYHLYLPALGEEFDLREDLAWTFFHTQKFSQNFYLSVQYYSLEQLFLFYVMVDSGKEIAEDYRANISISNDEQTASISFSGPVLAIDRLGYFFLFKKNISKHCFLEFPKQKNYF